jgi:hypothetical protein
MSHLKLLLPFGIPQAQMATDLLRELKLPGFATLLSLTGTARRTAFDPFSPALPHELWLSHALGLTAEIIQASSPPMARAAAAQRGMDVAVPACWFLLQPSHLHIARDHLVLTDRRQLALTDAEARTLFDEARPLFEEVGLALHYMDIENWLVRADDWAGLKTSTPDAACGHNIDLWLPSGPGDRNWRRLHNEVQMAWHAHPLNEEREARGQKRVNALWLWGGGAPQARSVVKSGGNDSESTPTLLRATDAPNAAQDLLQNLPDNAILLLDQLIEPALGNDWAEWLDRFHRLEANWFAPLQQALKAGDVKEIGLVLSGESVLAEHEPSRNPLRKLWTRPSLAKLTQPAPEKAAT